MKKLKEVCDTFPLFTLREGNYNVHFDEQSLNQGVYEYLKSVTPDRKLQNVLAGNNLLYGGVPDKTPLYIHALINYSFINSSWRLVDGSAQLATAIEDSIKQSGGVILRNHEAQKFIFENNELKYLQLADSQKIEAKYFISNIHPVTTLQMIDNPLIHKAYRDRINSLENTIEIGRAHV